MQLYMQNMFKARDFFLWLNFTILEEFPWNYYTHTYTYTYKNIITKNT